MPLYDRTYSEEADEIIGTMPSWIVRWGITLIFVLLALLFQLVLQVLQLLLLGGDVHLVEHKARHQIATDQHEARPQKKAGQKRRTLLLLFHAAGLLRRKMSALLPWSYQRVI